MRSKCRRLLSLSARKLMRKVDHRAKGAILTTWRVDEGGDLVELFSTYFLKSAHQIPESVMIPLLTQFDTLFRMQFRLKVTLTRSPGQSYLVPTTTGKIKLPQEKSNISEWCCLQPIQHLCDSTVSVLTYSSL